jgi:NAD(P)-dependent dehydrogenase (short-subunit alcohol dehydrogenase family)
MKLKDKVAINTGAAAGIGQHNVTVNNIAPGAFINCTGHTYYVDGGIVRYAGDR